jgi:hypothetical protein
MRRQPLPQVTAGARPPVVPASGRRCQRRPALSDPVAAAVAPLLPRRPLATSPRRPLVPSRRRRPSSGATPVRAWRPAVAPGRSVTRRRPPRRTRRHPDPDGAAAVAERRRTRPGASAPVLRDASPRARGDASSSSATAGANRRAGAVGADVDDVAIRIRHLVRAAADLGLGEVGGRALTGGLGASGATCSRWAVIGQSQPGKGCKQAAHPDLLFLPSCLSQLSQRPRDVK